MSASVGNADPFDLAVFDLDALSATGDITIGGTRVDVQANVSSRGQTERVILTEAGEEDALTVRYGVAPDELTRSLSLTTLGAGGGGVYRGLLAGLQPGTT